MVIKRFLMAGLALLCAAGALSAQEQTVDGAFGGVFRKVVNPDEGEMAREGRIIVIFGEKGVWFDAFLARADGHTAALRPDTSVGTTCQQHKQKQQDVIVSQSHSALLVGIR